MWREEDPMVRRYNSVILSLSGISTNEKINTYITAERNDAQKDTYTHTKEQSQKRKTRMLNDNHTHTHTHTHAQRASAWPDHVCVRTQLEVMN
jgi:hypothetical protein